MVFFIIITACLITMICIIMFVSIKSANAFRNHEIIIDAIRRYNLDKIDKHIYYDYILFGEMESLDDTVARISDWGYTNIVSPETFEKIKPFIEG